MSNQAPGPWGPQPAASEAEYKGRIIYTPQEISHQRFALKDHLST